VSDNAMPFGEVVAEAERRKASQNNTRPFHQDDLRAGAAALSRRLAMGPPVDVIVAVREVLDASGVVSSRIMRTPANEKKEKACPSIPTNSIETKAESALPIS
jgi:hypothetical protein